MRTRRGSGGSCPAWAGSERRLSGGACRRRRHHHHRRRHRPASRRPRRCCPCPCCACRRHRRHRHRRPASRTAGTGAARGCRAASAPRTSGPTRTSASGPTRTSASGPTRTSASAPTRRTGCSCAACSRRHHRHRRLRATRRSASSGSSPCSRRRRSASSRSRGSGSSCCRHRHHHRPHRTGARRVGRAFVFALLPPPRVERRLVLRLGLVLPRSALERARLGALVGLALALALALVEALEGGRGRTLVLALASLATVLEGRAVRAADAILLGGLAAGVERRVVRAAVPAAAAAPRRGLVPILVLDLGELRVLLRVLLDELPHLGLRDAVLGGLLLDAEVAARAPPVLARDLLLPRLGAHALDVRRDLPELAEALDAIAAVLALEVVRRHHVVGLVHEPPHHALVHVHVVVVVVDVDRPVVVRHEAVREVRVVRVVVPAAEVPAREVVRRVPRPVDRAAEEGDARAVAVAAVAPRAARVPPVPRVVVGVRDRVPPRVADPVRVRADVHVHDRAARPVGVVAGVAPVVVGRGVVVAPQVGIGVDALLPVVRLLGVPLRDVEVEIVERGAQVVRVPVERVAEDDGHVRVLGEQREELRRAEQRAEGLLLARRQVLDLVVETAVEVLEQRVHARHHLVVLGALPDGGLPRLLRVARRDPLELAAALRAAAGDRLDEVGVARQLEELLLVVLRVGLEQPLEGVLRVLLELLDVDEDVGLGGDLQRVLALVLGIDGKRLERFLVVLVHPVERAGQAGFRREGEQDGRERCDHAGEQHRGFRSGHTPRRPPAPMADPLAWIGRPTIGRHSIGPEGR